MTNSEPDPQVREILEQLDAATAMIHTYKCFYCQMASAVAPVVIVEDVDAGCNVAIVGVCGTCMEVDDDR